jgi:hypothetical protein
MTKARETMLVRLKNQAGIVKVFSIDAGEFDPEKHEPVNAPGAPAGTAMEMPTPAIAAPAVPAPAAPVETPAAEPVKHAAPAAKGGSQHSHSKSSAKHKKKAA